MAISHAWEALRGDPLPWLLDRQRPNLHWRALVSIVDRPLSSPAVVRARGGSNAVEPVAGLMTALGSDGSRFDDEAAWTRYSGPGWRALAAVQWGADPDDPRLHAVAHGVVSALTGEAGRDGSGAAADPVVVARSMQALAALGWCREPRFNQLMAWLEEAAPRSETGGWLDRRGRESPAIAVAVARGLAACGEARRPLLARRAVASLVRALDGAGGGVSEPGYPGLAETDEAEIVHALAGLDAPLVPAVQAALRSLQQQQDERGRWCRRRAVPQSLPAADVSSPGEPSRWLTLECVTAILHYGIAAGLPRMFPEKPRSGGL